jgi:hypothetical protein
MSEALGKVFTQADFQEAFGEIMLNGLDSVGTYIPLRTNKRFGLNIAIRPMVTRISEGVVLFGGKLRVGYTLDPSHQLVKSNVTDISDEVRVQRLKDYCKGFTWQRADKRRFSTVVGLGIASTVYDGAAVLEHIAENNVASEFITRLERTYKQYNDVTFASHKATAIEALNAAWMLQADSSSIFKPLPKATQLPDGIVGKQTPLLNKAQSKYRNNVVSFQQKVNDWAEEAAQETEEDSE